MTSLKWFALWIHGMVPKAPVEKQTVVCMWLPTLAAITVADLTTACLAFCCTGGWEDMPHIVTDQICSNFY
ncbi:hypothetical protein BJX96DRAFT_131554 [Aspergillus floccosus]